MDNLNPEVQQKWINALLSGKYQQGAQALRSEMNNFCCLGVLCDLIQTESYQWVEEHGGWLFRDNLRAQQSRMAIPGTLSEELGLSWSMQETLMELNDAGFTFAEIAIVIAHPELIPQIREMIRCPTELNSMDTTAYSTYKNQTIQRVRTLIQQTSL